MKIKCEADPSQPNCGKVVIYEKLQSGASLGSIKQRKYGFLNPNLTNYKVEFTNGQMVITIPTMAAGTEEFYYYFDLDNLSATGDVITHQKSLFDYSDGIKNATGQITGEEKVVKSECKRPQLKASREISFPDKCGKLANLRLTLECVKGTGAPNECCGSATISDIIDQKVVVYYKDGVYKFSDILNSRAPDLSKNLTPSQFGATLPNNGLCQGDKAFLEYGVEFKNFGNDQQPHNTALSRIYYDNGQGKGDEEIQIDSPKVNVGGSGCLKNAKKVEVKLPCVAKVQGDHNIAFSFDLSGTMLNSNAVSYAKAGAMAFLQSLYQSSASSKYQIALNYFAHINKGDMVHPIISLTGDKKAARTALGEVNFLNFTNGGTSLLQGVNLAADQLALSNNSGTKNIILVTNGDVNVDSFGNKCDPNDIDKVRFQNCKKDIINAAQKIGAGLKIDGVRLYIVNYDDDKKTATQKQNDEEIYSYLTAFQDDRIINVSGTGGRNEFEVAFYKIDNLINAGAQCFDTNVIISLPKDRLKSVADIFGGYEGVNKEKGRPPVDRASTYEMKWEKLDPFSGFTIVSFVSEGDITKYNVADGFNFYVVIDGTKERMSTKQNILPDSVTITEAK